MIEDFLSAIKKTEFFLIIVLLTSWSNDLTVLKNNFMGYGSDYIGGTGEDTIFVTNFNDSGLGVI